MSNLNSVTKLTEFPRLEPKERADGLLSKFMWWRKPEQAEKPGLPEVPTGDVQALTSVGSIPCVKEIEPLEGKPRSYRDDSSNSTVPSTFVTSSLSPLPSYYRSDSNLSNRSNQSPDVMDGSISPFTFEARTLPNVLRRISSLIAMGTNNQTDIKKYWMPDSVSKECYECAEKFTTFRRKHHCRICGQIFCSRCCNQEIPGKIIGYSGDLRVCTYCSKIVLSYLQSALSSDMSDDLRVVQEDLQNRFGSSEALHHHGNSSYGLLSSEHPSSYRSLPRRKISLGYQEERFVSSRSIHDNVFDSGGNLVDDKQKSLGDFVNLKSLWDEMTHPITGMDWATHRHNMMKNYHSCVVGSELVDWLLAQRKISWRGQGIQIGQMLIDANLIECVSQAEQIFLDAYALYRPTQLPLPPLPESSESSTRNSRDFGDGKDFQDPLWVKQISARFESDDSSKSRRDFLTGSQNFDPSKSRLPSTTSLYSLDLNLNDNTVSISKPREDKSGWDPYSNQHSPTASIKSTPRNPRKTHSMSITTETMTDEFLQNTLQLQNEQGKDFVAPTGWHSPQQLTNDTELMAFQRLCNAFVRHENELLNNLLESMNLSQSWADIILPIVHKVTEIVRPDVRHADDEMDIRHYVQFKKVCGGKKEDCRIVNGVICTKNIANRAMRYKLKDPKILLISSSIDYQRFENRFLSLEPLMMQEYEYLRNAVARIGSLQPDLVLVEKTVSRLAQDMMLEQGITLVINVKPSVMERVARCTQGVITTSADTQIGNMGRPQLGLCHNFYLENFQIADGVQKNLMFFDGCAMHLGCTVLLRGGHQTELMKVKRIISLLTFVAYNWRLERSFHIDLFAMPPDNYDRRDALRSPGESEDFMSAQEDSDSSKSVDSPAKKEKDNVEKENVEKRNAKSELCDDFSDPLQSYLANGEEPIASNSTEKLIVQYVPDSTKYSLRACLDEVRLSASPFIKYSVPYLETEDGKVCALRDFFPSEIYWSALLHRAQIGTNATHQLENNLIGSKNGKLVLPKIKWKAPHLFTALRMTVPIIADGVQSSIADFRRKGGRLDLTSVSESPMLTSNYLQCHLYDQDRQGNGRVDALDPFRHQKLSVLFCSYSSMSCNAPYFCVNPWVVNMDMYGRNDISLGMFLERYCFRKTYHCPARNCNTPMLFHLRRFVHEDGCVTVASKELESPIVGSGENILMWNWCCLCKTVSPIVPMSADAWSLSFAKYLELRFHGYLYERRGFDDHCRHSLHHDFIHYFAQHNIISWFKYSKIKLWEICLPETCISIKSQPKSVQQLIDDVKVVAITGHGVYSSILEALVSLKETSAGSRAEDVVTSLLDHLKAERMVFRSKIEEIQINLSVPTSETERLDKKEANAFLWKITDSIGFLRSNIADTIQSWNTKLHDLLVLRKKEEKQAKGTTKVDSESQEQTMRVNSSKFDSETATSSVVGFANISTNSSSKDLDESLKSTEQTSFESSGEHPSSRDQSSRNSGSTVDMSISGVLDELTNVSVPSTDEGAINTGSNDDLLSNVGNENVGDSKNSGIRASLSSLVTPNEYIRQKKENFDRSKTDEKLLKVNAEPPNLDDSPDYKMEKKLGSNTVKTLISHFLSGSALGQVIQSPWMSTDHHFLATFTAIPVSVHENEPSSVVAFALSSNEYKNKLADFNKTSQAKILRTSEDDDFLSKRPRYAEVGMDESQPSAGNSFSSKASEFVGEKTSLDLDLDEKERDRVVKGNGNVEVQFGSNTAKFYCRIYFAEQFRQLRCLSLQEKEEFYIRSVARCIPWNATGGKSGSTFCKTVDDRFVVKQMSKFEIQSFLDFAPNYFDYVRGCYQAKKPTVLAKILGVYRIGFRNSATNAQSKMDILIMENLFYERNISQKFDLKGSIRNRLATASGKEHEDLVLLDENLVNMACENPLYIRPHTKTVLTTALSNDSRFLSTQMVMDYSLLVGFDEQKNELVVGIIDYIRTFTWDKKIETFVKSSGILGGQGKMPTVVSPEEYQTRFCEAMDRYFLLVPDRWMGLGLGIDS